MTLNLRNVLNEFLELLDHLNERKQKELNDKIEICHIVAFQ